MYKYSNQKVYIHTLPHVRALAPVVKGLLPRFPSRCCPSGTKGPPFSPGSGNRGVKGSCQGCHVAGPFNTGWYYQPVLKGFFFFFLVHFFGSVYCLYIIYNNRFFNTCFSDTIIYLYYTHIKHIHDIYI